MAVSILVSGLGDYEAPSIGTFDLEVYFDSAVLGFIGYQFGDELGNMDLGEALDGSFGETGPGAINLYELSFLNADPTSGPAYFGPYLDDEQPGSFVLATLNFNALAPGTSFLDLYVNYLGDAWSNSLAADISAGAVCVAAAPVPEPSTFLLLAFGAVFLYLHRQRLTA